MSRNGAASPRIQRNRNGRIDPAAMRDLLHLYFVMGSVNCRLEPGTVLAEAIAGGVTMFQFREKGLGALVGEDQRILGARLRDICRAHGIPFIVNDDVKLALELDADGVHIGQEDGDARLVRSKIGDRILGISTHDVGEVRRAIADGADYVGVGPMFPTSTKQDAREVCGPAMIERIRAEYPQFPLVGIGGIKVDNIADVRRAGADGAAVISAISDAPDPRVAAERLAQ